MKWYALHVETGKEDFVRSEIRKQFDPSTILSIVPKRKLIERKQGVIYEKCRTLFPGYVFIKARMNVKTYHDLKKRFRDITNFLIIFVTMIVILSDMTTPLMKQKIPKRNCSPKSMKRKWL